MRKLNSSKIKSKKISTILLIIFFIILGLWLILKLLLVNWCNNITIQEEFLNGLNNRSYYKTSTHKINDDLYLEFEDIKFVNFINNTFVSDTVPTLSGNDAISYSSSTYKTALNIGKDYSYINMFTKEHTFFGDGEKMIPIHFYLSENKREDLLEENDIKNDLDFFTLVKDYSKIKVNILTPISKIREFGTVKLFSSVVFPSIDELVILDGEYEGYVFKNWTNSNGDVVSTEATYTLTVVQDETLTANYEEEVAVTPVTLTLTKEAAYDATADTLNLPTTVTFDYNNETVTENVTWDTTSFVVNQIGKQKLYGTLSNDSYKVNELSIEIDVLPYTFSLNEETNEYTINKYYGTGENNILVTNSKYGNEYDLGYLCP